MGVDSRLARVLWHRLETINAVTYFSAECRAAPETIGLKGFWMGYFGCRAAPMGAVKPSVVDATFFNFHPARVRRAIPDAWALASPADILEARSSSAASALRRLLSNHGAEALAGQTLAMLETAVDAGSPAGRPLFSANRDVARPSDPVACLWQSATTLREHRGDGHVALLTSANLDGCEAHVLFAACERLAPRLFQDSRGWSADDWLGACDRLRTRDLLDRDGNATERGLDARRQIERRTDELAAAAYVGLGDERLEQLAEALRAPATRIALAGEIAYPNPMGLPAPS